MRNTSRPCWSASRPTPERCPRRSVRIRASSARPTSSTANSKVWMPTSPQPARNTGPNHGHHGARCPDTQSARADGAQAQIQERQEDLRPAQSDRGAGIRAKQGSSWPQAVPAAGPGEGERRMVANVHRSQPPQAVQGHHDGGLRGAGDASTQIPGIWPEISTPQAAKSTRRPIISRPEAARPACSCEAGRFRETAS